MNQLRVATTTLFLLLMLFVQETIINRINFPWHSFSLYLAALLVLLAFEDRTGALVFGFLGETNGGFLHNFGVIAANSVWSFFITPIFLPLIIRFRKFSLSSRDLI